MKRSTALIIVFAILFTFTSCGNKTQSVPDAPQSADRTPDRVMEIAKTPDKDLKIWDVLPEIPETPSSELEYKITENGAEVTGYKGSGTGVRVPETIEGKKVISVRFEDLQADEVIFPKTAERCVLGNCAAKYVNVVCADMMIYGSHDIQKAYVEDGVAELDDSLFFGCKALQTVRMGSDIKVINDSAFGSCESLSEIEIPDGVEYIGDAFRHTALTSFALPDSLVGLHAAAFVGTSAELKVTAKGNTYSRLDDELYKLYYKDDLLIYNGVVKDHWRWAEGELVIPEGVTEIGDYAITFNDTITKITLPKSMKIIHDGAFNGCKALSEIVIPEGVTEIGALVFDGCKSLKKIALPDSLTELDNMAFADISYNEEDAFKDFEIMYKGKTYAYTNEDIRELYSLFYKPFYGEVE